MLVQMCVCRPSCYLLLEASKYVEEKSYTGLARAVGGKGGTTCSCCFIQCVPRFGWCFVR